MSKPRYTKKKKPKSTDAPFSRLESDMFRKYGGMTHVDYDEFHAKYPSVDVRSDPEVRGQRTSVLGDGGHMNDRTYRSLELLREFGPDRMDMKQWNKLVDSAPRPEAVPLVMTDADPRQKAALEARYGEAGTGSEAMVPPVHVHMSVPMQVAWDGFGILLQDLEPGHFLEPGTTPPRELEFALAPLLHKQRNEMSWNRAFKSAVLEPYTNRNFLDTHILKYWFSRGSRLFVVFLLTKEGRLDNYFYVPVAQNA